MKKWFYPFLSPEGAGGGMGGNAEGINSEGIGEGAAGGAEPPKTDPATIIKSGLQQEPQEPDVPEEYTFNLAEGLEISDELKSKLTEIGKESKISQKTMDALLQMHGDIMLTTMREAEDRLNGWAAECQKQGLCSEENLALAKLAVNTFGGGEAMQALIDTGAANHPAVQKMLQVIGGMLQEDNAPDGSNPAKENDDIGKLLFSNSKYE